MTIVERLENILTIKFCFGKQHLFLYQFSQTVQGLSMFDGGYGLSIPFSLPAENQLRGVFLEVLNRGGFFVFNINGLNLDKATHGFASYEEAETYGLITEWELSIILANNYYLERTIFHNQITEIPQILNGIQFLWN